MDRDTLLKFVRGADVAVTMFSDKVDEAFLEAAGPRLRGVCNFAVGFNNIDVELCKARGVAVTNTPDAVTEGTADMAWALLLATARRLVEADRYARTGAWARGGILGMDDFMGVDLTGRTLLIVGAGRIGFATAMRSIGWMGPVQGKARKPVGTGASAAGAMATGSASGGASADIATAGAARPRSAALKS